MPSAARVGDIQSGHACHCPPTNAISGSPNVLINGSAAVRVGDSFAPHGCPLCLIPVHPVVLAEGSSSVLINGSPAGRVDDPTSCGGIVITGSDNVLIGG